MQIARQGELSHHRLATEEPDQGSVRLLCLAGQSLVCERIVVMKRLAIFVLFFSYSASGQTQIIKTVAGSGATGTAIGANFAGDGGPATSALLNQPGSVFLDASGDIFIADTANS